MMDYSDSLKEVLIRKINKTERDLCQLKMDYCRFVFGITHRSKVNHCGQLYQVKSVSIDSMQRNEMGEWSKPKIFGVKVSIDKSINTLNEDEFVQLDTQWKLATPDELLGNAS